MVVAALLAAVLATGPAVPTAAPPSSSAPSTAVGARGNLPDDRALEAEGAVFGAIRIRAGDVFDTTLPEEDNWFFRTANRLHVRTRESVIRSRLLFREGDPYSRRLMEESERILRSLKFLYDARIRPVARDGSRVDVEVETRDVWTLRAGVGFGRAGGENTLRLGLQDANFAGFGKDLTVQRTSDVDRTEQLYRYMDPGILSSRVRAVLAYSDNSDGRTVRLSAERPFFSLDARWAAGVAAEDDDRIESHYDLGEAIYRFRQRSERASLWVGFSRGLRAGRALRLETGWTWDRESFEEADDGSSAPFPLPGRTLSYPWIGLASVEDGFVTARDMDKIERTEDLNLAQEGRLRVGRAVPAFGSDRSATILDGSWRLGAALGRGRTLLASAGLSGRREGAGFANVLAEGSVRWLERNFGPHLFHAALHAHAAHRLDPERQLLIGGDSGLRGYPLRYQSGDRRVLLSAEQRFYFDPHVFRLFYLGAAAFVDVGRAWSRDDGGTTHLGWLRDVGVGLRVQSSRSAHASMLHLDLAYPLDGEADIRKIQVSLTTAETF